MKASLVCLILPSASYQIIPPAKSTAYHAFRLRRNHFIRIHDGRKCSHGAKFSTSRGHSYLPKIAYSEFANIDDTPTRITNNNVTRRTYPLSPILKARINDLTNHPAVVWNRETTFSSMNKKKLGRRHLPLFDRSSTNDPRDFLFDEFAKVVCNASVVARKEVFETWASALYISDYFFKRQGNCKPIRRVADIASGHGLLAWALLLLDDENRRGQVRSMGNANTGDALPPLTVFCLDLQMPQSAESIHSAMTHRFPNLDGRFDYVEGRLEQLIPHQSCLLASVHACGTLSDSLVSTAAKHAIPLALVPCCHSRKPEVLRAASSPFAREEYEAILNTKDRMPDLVDRLDEARMVALENSGMNVVEAHLPKLFTDKNRLIMAHSDEVRDDSVLKATSRANGQYGLSRLSASLKLRQMPPLESHETWLKSVMVNPKPRFMKGFYVPSEDSQFQRLLVSKLSGRAAAVTRKEIMHNRNHKSAPQFDVSLWLSPEGSVTEQAVCAIVESEYPHIKCNVSNLGAPYTDPETGRVASTFRVRYTNRDGTGIVLFEDANKMHKSLYTILPSSFPGSTCR